MTVNTAIDRYLAMVNERTTGAGVGSGPASDGPAPGSGPASVTAAELLAREFQPVRMAVAGLVPEGVTVLAGRPKLGKSILALALSVAVAAGAPALGTLAVASGEALYLALEDGERRLQARLRQALGGRPTPAGWHYQTRWPALDTGGLEALAGWLAEHPEARLVVIDTLKRVRPRETAASLYGQDYDALAPLADLAAARQVGILVVHHTRKAAAEDALDLVSGSTGLTAAADAVLVLQRARGTDEATLTVIGRDLEEKELALRRDPTTLGWQVLGEANVVRLGRESQAILDVVRAAGGPMTPKQIAAALDRPDTGSIRHLLRTLVEANSVVQVGYGQYTCTPMPAPVKPPGAALVEPSAPAPAPKAASAAPAGGSSSPTTEGCLLCEQPAAHRNAAGLPYCAVHWRAYDGGG